MPRWGDFIFHSLYAEMKGIQVPTEKLPPVSGVLGGFQTCYCFYSWKHHCCLFSLPFISQELIQKA